MGMYQADHHQSCFQQESAELVTETRPYYVELPLEALDEQGSLLDVLFHLTFDTLNVQHLDLRIVTDAG